MIDHSGEAVTWERLRDAHSCMLGDKSWEPSSVDPPNSGHRVYKQLGREQCYMCAALDLIAQAAARINRLELLGQALVDKLDECHPHMMNQAAYMHAHGFNYDGPQYGVALEEFRAVLKVDES
jgi:hypothetical protein